MMRMFLRAAASLVLVGAPLSFAAATDAAKLVDSPRLRLPTS
jgi:hypothetical protein